MIYDKDFEELDAELAGTNYGEEFDYDMEDSNSDEGIAADVLGSARKTAKKGLEASPTIKGNATEGITNEVTPTTTLTIAETDPYGNTAKVAEKVYGSFSDTLRDMYAKREKAREKRKRTAEKVAVGHALGDLFGAISAHYISGQKNSRAVVPQSLAPKSYAKIQALIDEGVADQNTFDKYMLSLTQEKGKHDINVAKARDKAAVDLAMQKRKEDEAERERQAKDKAAKEKMEFEAEQNKLKGDNAVRVAQINAENRGKKDSDGGGSKNKPLTEWQRRMAMAVMPKDSSSTRVEKGVNGLPDTESTTTKRYEPGKEDMFNHYATAEGIAKKWGLSADENGASEFETLYSLIGKKTAAGNVLTIDGIAALLKGGYNISQIKEVVK